MAQSETTQIREYDVEGMTCTHCVQSVREEILELAGVAEVDVDLASGRVTVYGSKVSDDAVLDAVRTAGYAVGS